ncbi:MAG: hypothetical protein ABWZ76_06995 [Acidimicrobiales bacterium]
MRHGGADALTGEDGEAVRFDELILQTPDDELQMRFHAQLTVLSGLGLDDRAALTDSILGALAGGPETTTLRYLDAAGQAVTVLGRDGRVSARRDDGTPVAEPLGTIAPDAHALRRLMLITADDLGAPAGRVRESEPPELREARDTLEEVTAALDAARGRAQGLVDLQAQLDALDDELRAARDGAARRDYALVLAQLERVRGEAAAQQTDEDGIQADRRLLANADGARELAERWAAAAALVAELEAKVPDERLDAEERDELATIPAVAPAELPDLVDALTATARRRDQIDRRLHELAVAKLPAPSDPMVAELGLLDQTNLWEAGSRLTEANESMHRVQLSLGGLDLDDLGPPPALIQDIEIAHSAVEESERAEEAAKVPAVAAATACLLAAAVGITAAPVLIPVGLLGAGVAAGVGLVRPQARRARAVDAEAEALARAEATSYLGFHIRRVEASVDPKLREGVESTLAEQHAAQAAWASLAGSDADVTTVTALASEITAYNDAVQDLGETAEEMEQLRRELDDVASPAWRTARDALATACSPFHLDDEQLDDPRIAMLVEHQCRRGGSARLQVAWHEAAGRQAELSARLDDLLLQLGFDTGELPARVGALEWGVTRAEEREDARRRARPRREIDADLAELRDTAERLRQPEWADVTPADAAAPDIAGLEARRGSVIEDLNRGRAEVDLERLADRHAAIERRVSALEARLSPNDGASDPGAIAEMQERLLTRVTTAAHAGPQGEPVPVVLDEALLRVPPDRTWDVLDQLLHLSEQPHQMIFLTDDAFVAAWARQRVLDGSIGLLEPAPEAAPDPV